MIDLTQMEAELIAAELDLTEAQARTDALAAEHTEAVAAIAAARPRPDVLNFADIESWRQAVDGRQFALTTAIAKRKETTTQHIAAAQRLEAARSTRDALQAKLNLARAANQAEGGDCDLTTVQRARDAYFEVAPEYRPHDADLMAAVNAAQVHAFLGFVPAARAHARG